MSKRCGVTVVTVEDKLVAYEFVSQKLVRSLE
jgi:hypothetical protein